MDTAGLLLGLKRLVPLEQIHSCLLVKMKLNMCFFFQRDYLQTQLDFLTSQNGQKNNINTQHNLYNN